MSELAPPAPAALRRRQRLDAVRRMEEQLARLQAQLRLELAALVTEDRAGLATRYVADEFALVMHRSPRQARNRQEQAEVFAGFPAVHALIDDGSWLMDHADAALEELVGSGLDHAQQQQVLALVLQRRRLRMTPYEVRVAVRTALVVLFPEHALDKADKAELDRDVRCYVDAPGVATLVAYGPAPAIAAMWASLDALVFPAAPGDPRDVKQRRFDALQDLVCGRLTPTSWQAQLLVALTTVQGQDELPAEIPGFGPIPAQQARELVAAGASLRRIVVDEQTGQLVAVDRTVHRPDLPPQPPDPGVSDQVEPPDPDTEPDEDAAHPDELGWDGCDGDGGAGWPDRDPGRDPEPSTAVACPAVDPEPDPPTSQDCDWYDENLDRTGIYQEVDIQLGFARAAHEDLAPATTSGCDAVEIPAVTVERKAPRPISWSWSATALGSALGRLTTDPVKPLDLHSDRYAVPKALKRFLELRDRTCIFPGCPRKAMHCDKDHLIPWPRGSTSESNLADECEHHHQGKHDCLSVQRLPDGTFRWATPCGITGDRLPRPVLDAWTYRALEP